MEHPGITLGQFESPMLHHRETLDYSRAFLRFGVSGTIIEFQTAFDWVTRTGSKAVFLFPLVNSGRSAAPAGGLLLLALV